MVDQQKLWDERAAREYDTPGTGMFAPEVLGPTVEVLAELAGDGPALELAVGTGRVAIPLRETGVEVHGIELSPSMIARLREKVGPDEIPVVRGDMRSAVAGRGFRLVYLVFNGISNLLTQDAQVECFRSAARQLAPADASSSSSGCRSCGRSRRGAARRWRSASPDICWSTPMTRSSSR